MVQQTTAQMLNEPSITHKIEIVDSDIKKLQADGGSPRKVESLIEYKKFLEEQLVTFTDTGCIRKSKLDTNCIPPTNI